VANTYWTGEAEAFSTYKHSRFVAYKWI